MVIVIYLFLSTKHFCSVFVNQEVAEPNPTGPAVVDARAVLRISPSLSALLGACSSLCPGFCPLALALSLASCLLSSLPGICGLGFWPLPSLFRPQPDQIPHTHPSVYSTLQKRQSAHLSRGSKHFCCYIFTSLDYRTQHVAFVTLLTWLTALSALLPLRKPAFFWLRRCTCLWPLFIWDHLSGTLPSHHTSPLILQDPATSGPVQPSFPLPPETFMFISVELSP